MVSFLWIPLIRIAETSVSTPRSSLEGALLVVKFSLCVSLSQSSGFSVLVALLGQRMETVMSSLSWPMPAKLSHWHVGPPSGWLLQGLFFSSKER